MQASLVTSSVAPTTIASQLSAQSEGVGDSTLTQEDFLNLLVVELQNQDPLEPEDDTEFITQTVAFSQLEALTTMNSSLETMVELLTMQAYNNSSLTSGANFIGMEIEYQTNTVQVGDGTSNTISFYLGSAASAENSTIYVYNSEGSCVAIITPDTDLVAGQNTIVWDGTGISGTSVDAGTYYFDVVAYDSSGALVEVQEYGTGIVEGVKLVSGVLYFDIGDGVVSSEYVYSVYAPETTEEETTTE